MGIEIRLGSRLIGDGQPAYIVAEIGVNHNGDMQLARDMILAARDAGADAVKFQNYRTEDFIFDRSITHTYVSEGQEITEPQYDMFKRYELTESQLSELVHFCNENSIDVHSTPTNREGIKQLQELGIGVMKNGSDYLGHIPLINSMAETGIPVVLSTGMASRQEIEDAVSTVLDTGNKDVILLYCVSQYPAPVSEVNLRQLQGLRERFNCLVGFSDHTHGGFVSSVAVANGACWIEKHFTLDHNLPGPDHSFSTTPVEFREMVEQIRTVEQLLNPINSDCLSADEEHSRQAFKLSCAASSDIASGTVLDENHIAFYRPGTGIPPSDLNLLLGKKLKHSISHGQQFRMEDLCD